MNIDNITGQYNGATAFLIGGGPSFSKIDKEKLSKSGAVIVGLNNSPSTFRPNIWVGVDTPDTFLDSVWTDPNIMKLYPAGYGSHKVKIKTGDVTNEHNVYDLPNVIKFRLNNVFSTDTFFTESTVNYGNTSSSDGARSVFLASIKLLYILGFKKVFLLGVDFKMEEGASNYHYDEESDQHHVKMNNNSYEVNNKRLKSLRKTIDALDYKIYNCNKESGLMAFDYISFDEAFDIASEGVIDTLTENTFGMYKAAAKLRQERKRERNPVKRGARVRQNRKKNVKPIKVSNQIALTGISRSGTHAVLNWIASQYNGRIEYRNNLFRHISDKYLHDPQSGKAPRHWYNLPNIESGDCSGNIDNFIYSYENQMGGNFDFHKSVISDTGKKVVLLRDPFNLLASSHKCTTEGNRFWFYKACCVNGNVNIDKLHRFYDMWMSHASLIDRDDVIPILYNKWFVDSDYRDSIAEKLGVDHRTDSSMERVPANGLGSSFDKRKMDGNGSGMDVLNRFNSIINYDWFIEFIKRYPDLVNKSNELFGEIL